MTARAALLLSVVLLLSAPGAAQAGGLNVNWGTVCYTKAPANVLLFACDSNTEPAGWPMTMSFMIDTPMSDFVGVEIVMEGLAPGPALPDWWEAGTVPGCRAGVSSYTADLTAVGDSICRDWTQGQSYQLFEYTWDTNRTHISGGAARNGMDPVPLEAGREYYAGTITILNGRATGEGACGGCSGGFAWTLYSIVVAGLDGRRDLVDMAMPGGNTCLIWNAIDWGEYGYCFVPARATTWGQVKSLYR